MTEAFEHVVNFLMAQFPYANYLQAFWMAFQGAMAIRNGLNKSGKMHPFHAFAAGVCTAFGGALFTPFLMGKATSMLSNDLNFFCCAVTFLIVNYLPLQLGYKFGNTFLGELLTVSFSQMFRCMGIVTYLKIAHDSFKGTTILYPVPIVGPVMYATLLGNMGPFVMKGFEAHLKDGIPWAFQNGTYPTMIPLERERERKTGLDNPIRPRFGERLKQSNQTNLHQSSPSHTYVVGFLPCPIPFRSVPFRCGRVVCCGKRHNRFVLFDVLPLLHQ